MPKTIKPNQNERAILTYLNQHRTATLGELAKRFERAVKVPRKWTYATETAPAKRLKFRASLLARNGIRRLVRERLVRKVTPGVYRITPAGRRRSLDLAC